MSFKYFALALAATAAAAPGSPFQALEAQASNDNPCEPCQPSGATASSAPSVGSGLSSLYTDVLNSVKDINFSKRDLTGRATNSGFCCVKSLNCVNVQSVNIAMCYDKFTTNFKLADGSFGSLTTGEYTSSDNQQVNLLSGDYSGGNIYASAPQDKPNTATLSVPPQYTGTGVGAAIPASELGSIIVYTTTIPALHSPPRRFTAHPIERSPGRTPNEYRSPPRAWTRGCSRDIAAGGLAPQRYENRYSDLRRDRVDYLEDSFRGRSKFDRPILSDWPLRNHERDEFITERKGFERRPASPPLPLLPQRGRWARDVRERSRSPIRDPIRSPLRISLRSPRGLPPKDFRRDVFVEREHIYRRGLGQERDGGPF